MDLVTGLSAASTAISIAKDLREIDRGVDEAAYKLKLAELTEALADTKLALAGAQEEMSNLRGQLDALVNGDFCPKCRVGRMQLESTKPKLQYGLNHLGVENWVFACDNSECGFEQKRLHDPHGAIPAQARK